MDDALLTIFVFAVVFIALAVGICVLAVVAVAWEHKVGVFGDHCQGDQDGEG